MVSPNVIDGLSNRETSHLKKLETRTLTPKITSAPGTSASLSVATRGLAFPGASQHSSSSVGSVLPSLESWIHSWHHQHSDGWREKRKSISEKSEQTNKRFPLGVIIIEDFPPAQVSITANVAHTQFPHACLVVRGWILILGHIPSAVVGSR